ncbi:MAG: hypothetical protein JW822_12005 [Spirochaetales bacterium]|nr:hypothetical protein [Spirochaetales bacterium]
MIRWNIAIYSGLGAFGLSCIIGILSGNPLVAIIFRALLFGVIFAGLGAAGSFIIHKYLPEILNSEDQPRKETAASENVDIVLPEEGPVLGESLLEDKEKISNDSIDEIEETEELETAEEVESAESIDGYEDIEEGKEGIQTEIQPQEEEESVTEEDSYEKSYDNIVVEEINHDEDDNLDKEDIAEQKDEIQEQEDRAEQSSETSPDKISDEELDELPDMGVLENSFMVISSEGQSESGALDGVQSKIPGKMTKKQDPEVYAQAVRTIIKRDEEGPKKYGR